MSESIQSRRAFLASAALSLAAQPPGKRPNILVLFSDDQRFSTLNALNNSEVKTPNLDRLVRSGTAFDHAMIMGGTIGAVCVPSRAMLLAGQTLFHIHDSIVAPVQAKRPAKPYTMFPELFRRAGYTTFHTGKWHNGERTYGPCFTRGENIFFGGMSDHDKVPVADFDPAGVYPKEKRRIAGGFSSEIFSDSAIRFLKEHRGDNPFLMYIAYTAPHDPRMAPKEYAAMYQPGKVTLPKNFLPEHPFDNGEMKVRDEGLAPWPRTPEIIREHIAAYYAMITHLDTQIGRVLKALEETGHAKNTLVVFAADNGLAVGQHGLMGKQNLYDHSIRVPLVFHGPGIPKGRTNTSACYLLDIYPTLCEYAGVAAPSTVEGTSLMPAIRGTRKQVRDTTFHAYRDVQRAVRTSDWKLIVYKVNGQRTVQLFHLAADPLETTNLANETAQAPRIREMTALLVDWMKKVDDPLPPAAIQ
jgi:arylsulfatase A-like enzyme